VPEFSIDGFRQAELQAHACRSQADKVPVAREAEMIQIGRSRDDTAREDGMRDNQFLCKQKK